MDFSRARTVLIWVFLFLNLFLLYQIWLGEGGGDYIFTGHKEEGSRLQAALQEAGFSLETPLPRGGARLGHLVVKPGQLEIDGLFAALWPLLEPGEESPPPVVPEKPPAAGDGSEGGRIYSCGEYRLYQQKDGLLVLERDSKSALQQENRHYAEMLPAIRDNFRKNTFLKGFVADYVQSTPQGSIVYYRQEYGDYPLYGGYLEIRPDKGGYPVFTLYRLEPLGFAEQTRDVISPAAALLRFLEAYGVGKDTVKKDIVEIALGYYSHGYDAERWEIPPVWRIRLGSGEIYYVNAFTGNLEK